MSTFFNPGARFPRMNQKKTQMRAPHHVKTAMAQFIGQFSAPVAAKMHQAIVISVR